MADLGEIESWAEHHPYATAAIVFGGGIGLLWLFGFFGSSTQSTSSAGNAAAAYYQAEAMQTQAGTALAIAQSNNQAQTAQSLIQAQGAVAINQSNNTASQAIATTMYGAQTAEAQIGATAATTQAGYAADVAKTQAFYGNNTAVTQANDAMATAISGQNFAYQTAVAGNAAQALLTAETTIIPLEAQLGHGTASGTIPGVGGFSLNVPAPPPPVVIQQVMSQSAPTPTPSVQAPAMGMNWFTGGAGPVGNDWMPGNEGGSAGNEGAGGMG